MDETTNINEEPKEKPQGFSDLPEEPEQRFINRRSIISAIVTVCLIALFALGVYFYIKNAPASQNNTGNQTPEAGTAITKNMVFGITDSSSPAIENIEAVFITIHDLQIRHSEKGWIDVFGDAQQYDLISLKRENAVFLVTDVDVDAGTYDQVGLTMGNVTVVERGTQKEATLPLGDIKIFGNIVVNEGQQSTIVFDIAAIRSLYQTDAGEFIFVPIIKLQSRSNTVSHLNQEGEIAIVGGQVETDKSVGMDINGEVKTNFILDENAKLSIIGGAIKLEAPGEDDPSVQITPQMAIDLVTKEGYLDQAIAVKLVTKNNEQAWLVSGLKNVEMSNVYISAKTGFVITIANATYESCLDEIDRTVGGFNSCTLDSGCVAMPVLCSMKSINSGLTSAFNDQLEQIKPECQIVFSSICTLPEPDNFNQACVSNRCVAIPKPVYEVQMEDIRFVLELSEELGNVLQSSQTYVTKLTTTEKFIKVTVGAQNKGKGNIAPYTWDLGNIIDSEARNFVPITNRAYAFLPQPDLCGDLLKPEFDLTPCVRIYEVSKISTGLKVEVILTSPKKDKALLDLKF